jgi:hypothetical protein
MPSITKAISRKIHTEAFSLQKILLTYIIHMLGNIFNASYRHISKDTSVDSSDFMFVPMHKGWSNRK